MKVLLLVPPELYTIQSYVSEKITETRELRPKLGLLCIAGYLREHTGITPVIVDCAAEGYAMKDIESVIRNHQPHLVGMSVLTFNLIECLEAAKIIKRVDASIKVCFGGFHPTLYPGETVAYNAVDYVVVGEGERTFTELVKYMANGGRGDLRGIDGLVWKDSTGDLIENKARQIADDLDELGQPAHDLIDITRYSHALSTEGYTAYVQTSRGCPFRCRFCDIRMSEFRSRSTESVFREIESLVRRNVREVFFLDDTITVKKKRLIELCSRLIEERIEIKYKISSRVNTIDEEMLSYLKRSGCTRIHYGVESGSQRILDVLQKGITVEQIVKAFEMTKRFGILTYAYLMIGAPSETQEDIDETIALVKRIRPNYLTCSICTPFPKTELYEDLLRQGFYEKDYWHEFAQNPNQNFRMRYANKNFTADELQRMREMIMADFYSSGTFVLHELLRTRSLKQLLKKAKVGYKILFS